MRSKPTRSSFSSIPWRQAAQEAWTLFVLALLFALLFNAFYPYGIALKVEPSKNSHLLQGTKSAKNPAAYSGWGASSKSMPASVIENLTLDQMPRVDLVGAKNRFDLKDAVFLDARSPEEYQDGHIPGAINYYAEDLDGFTPKVLPQLPAKDHELIAYCHGSSCDLSLKLAQTLMKQGYSNVKVFFGGWPEWKKANYPVQTGDRP